MKKKKVYFPIAIIVRKLLCTLAVLALCSPALSSPPGYGSGKPTADKIRYC
jgi:hypothetical protein